MSLEQSIASLEAAVKELGEIVAAQTSFMTNLQKGEAPAAAKPAAAKPAAAKPAAGKKPAAAKKKTPEDLISAAGKYLQGTSDKAERNRLVATVRPMLEHFGVAKVSDIEADNVEEAMGYIAMLQTAYDDADEGEKVDAAEAVDLGLSNEPDEEDVI